MPTLFQTASPKTKTDFHSLLSGSVSSGLQYTPCGRCIVYPLGSVVVLKSVNSKNVLFFDAGIDKKVSCVALSKDGRYLATGHEAEGMTKVEAIIWDLESAIDHCTSELGDESSSDNCARILHRLSQHHGKVQSLDFSYDASYLITLGGQDDNDLVVWDVQNGKAICGSPAANDTTYCVKWLNQRNDRFVSCGNYHFRVWQVCTATPKLHAVNASMGSIRRVMKCLGISDDDKFGFAGSKTGEVLKFRIDRDEIKQFDEPDDLQPSLEGYNQERLTKGVKSLTCVINPLTGNTNVIAGAGNGTIQLLNPKLQLIHSHRAELDGGVTSISLDPTTSKTFIVGTEFSQRYSIDITTFTPELRGSCHYAEIFDVKFPRGCSNLFATASYEDIRVWDSKHMQELLRIRVPNISCRAIDITPSGSSIVSAWSDGKIRSFFPETGKSKFVIPDAHPDEVTALTTCNDDDTKYDWRLVSGGKEGGIRVWIVTQSHQRLLHSMKEHRGSVNALVCNKDGSKVVSASSDGSCIVWDLDKGIRIHALFENTVFKDMVFHPDESQYLTCGTNKLSYWDAYDAGAIRVVDTGDAAMTCLDIRSDGEMFVSGSSDKRVEIWNYDEGVVNKKGNVRHSGVINSVALSPDETRLVSVDTEGGIFIWRIS
jgi:WD40 repeat protein